MRNVIVAIAVSMWGAGALGGCGSGDRPLPDAGVDAARADGGATDGGRGDDGGATEDGGGTEDGGLDGGPECTIASDCPAPADECSAADCVDATCAVVPVADGTALSAQTAGDCRREVCDGAGGTRSDVDDSDVPDDGNACTNDACSSGVPMSANVAAGTSCGSAGMICDGAGACVGCLDASMCPGTAGECSTPICTAGVCGTAFQSTGTPVAAQSAGDCSENVCDGSGGTTTQPDDADLPADDGNACTTEGCSAGAAVHPPQPAGTACTRAGGGAGVCDGAGACVECASDTDCAAADAACSGGVCVHLLIAEVQTRGTNGGADELVEIYNPGSTPVTFDASWHVESISLTSCAFSTRFSGTGSVIPPHASILFTNASATGYDGAVASDGSYTTGFSDAGHIRLVHDTRRIDGVCFFFNATTQGQVTACGGCEGTPVSNLPHNNTTTGASATDVSIERRPGGALGNGQDTGDNLADFSSAVIASPQSLASPPRP